MLTPRFLPVAAHPIAFFAVDLVTMIFWFSGFIALAVAANSYHASYNYVGGYVYYNTKWYKLAVAATVFGAFEW